VFTPEQKNIRDRLNNMPVQLHTQITLDEIDRLATPANYRYGKAIHARGAVVFIEFGAHTIAGWVGGLSGAVAEGGGQRRRTQFAAGKTGLEWQCTCSTKMKSVFCKHCVALALATLDRTPGHDDRQEGNQVAS
jgi:uncharacterized Zn finger protein